MGKLSAFQVPPTDSTAKHSRHCLMMTVSLLKVLLTHMQASSRTFDMIEKRETLPSISSWGQTIWSGYGGSGKSVEPHSYAARVTDAM